MSDCAPLQTSELARSVAGRSSLHRIVRGHLRATLYLGDCLEILPELEGVDAVISDPPYGIANESDGPVSPNRKGLRNTDQTPYGRFTGQIIGDAEPFDPTPWLRWPCVLWGAGYYHERLPRGAWLLWDKKCSGGFEDWDAGDGDMAWMNREGAPRVFRMVWMGLVRGEVEKVNGGQNAPSAHPNQKPVALMGWSMERAKIPVGATVLDPFMGSGTTGLACLRTGRNFIGIEKDPAHFATAVARLEREANQGALL